MHLYSISFCNCLLLSFQRRQHRQQKKEFDGRRRWIQGWRDAMTERSTSAKQRPWSSCGFSAASSEKI